MTIQQEAANLIYILSDENVKLIVDVRRKMLTPVIEGTVKNKSLDTSKRIGLGKGLSMILKALMCGIRKFPIYLRVQTYEISGRYTYFNMGIV